MSEESSPFGKELERLFGEWSEAMKNDDVNRASIAMNAIWVSFQIMAAAITAPELKELTYLKVPFQFDNGGSYLLTFMHVDGPKIPLQGDSGNAITKKFEKVR